MAGLVDVKFEKYVNHSCHSSSLTRMYDKNQDEQVIMEVGGHRSIGGVHTYKHTSDKIRRQASAAIQGGIKVGEDILVCDENGNIVKRNDIADKESDMEDFEKVGMKIRTPKIAKNHSQRLYLKSLTTVLQLLMKSIQIQKVFAI